MIFDDADGSSSEKAFIIVLFFDLLRECLCAGQAGLSDRLIFLQSVNLLISNSVCKMKHDYPLTETVFLRGEVSIRENSYILV